MKNLLNVLVLVLAINFLAVVGFVGWLVQSGKIDRDKAQALREMIFEQPKVELALEPVMDVSAPATTRPSARLEQLLADKTGLSTSQQIDFLQQSFDRRMAELDRRERELLALQTQIEVAAAQVQNDRQALSSEKTALDEVQQAAAATAEDKGFQDSLALYVAMPAKQVKQVFLSLDDETVVRYLTAMPPRTAAKIVKEFKTPSEIDRIQTVMERMRLAGVITED